MSLLVVVKKSAWIIVLGFLSILVVILSLTLSGNYLKDKKEKAGVECQQVGQEHFVEAKDNKMQPETTDAKLCDKLTITNKDDKLRRIAFGEHENHIAYNGVSEKILRKDQSFTVVLNQPGEFLFHDHLQEEVQGQFIVSN